MKCLTWLHLSDIHSQATDEFNRGIVTTSLMEDIKDQCDKGLQPDFIAISGDLAYHGRDEEYQLAVDKFLEPLLKATGLSRRELFLVPGNHDVNWEAVEFLSPNLYNILDTRDMVNEFMGSEKKREIIFQVMASYKKFVIEFFGQDWDPHDDPLYACTRTYTKKGNTETKVGILGLNSAWLSGFSRASGGDYGKLLIGERQAYDSVEKARGADVVITLLHHPFEWLREFDRIDVESRLRESCEFILRGHLHSPGFLSELTLEGGTITIPCGAAYLRRDYPDGYNFVQLDLEANRGIIWLWRYSDRQRKWIKDIETTGEVRDGRVEFSWGKERSPQATETVELTDQVVRVSKVKVVESLAIAPVQERFWMRLEILYERFRPCYEVCTLAKVEGKHALSDGDFKKFFQAWERCKGEAYYDTVVHGEQMVELVPSTQQHLEKLNDDRKRIEDELKRHSRTEIVEAGLLFNEDLMRFLAIMRNRLRTK